MSNNDFFTIFIFPFKYEKGDKSVMKPVDIIKFLGSHKNNLLKDNPQEGWCLREFELNTIENYNEFYYFHPNVQKVIFNKNTFQKHKSMRYLIREDFKFLEAKFYGSNNKEITVMTEIKSIDLHLFDNQIGLITITTQKHQNNNETTFENFLQYNDTVRRIYPPFLGDNSTQTTKEKRLLPTQIILKDKTGNVKGTEDFNPINLNDPQNKGKDILYLSNVIREILIPFELKEKYYNDELEKDKIYYTPFIDDRMFVVSYYSDQELFNKLKTNYETVDEWYRFIFVDGNYANIKNDTMKKSLVQKHTYTRWLNSGTLYGMSRYGFVMLCDGSEDYLRQHMKSIYYQMSLIILFQRMMLLKFAEEVDEVTKHFEETETDFVELQEKTKELHADFIKFINKYWFIEITPQEQGIEIYNQWKGLLDLEELYDEVHREISELAEYVDDRIEFETNKNIETITYVSLPLTFIILTVNFWIITLMFIDLFKDSVNLFHSFKYTFIVSLGFSILISIILFTTFRIEIRKLLRTIAQKLWKF